MRRTRFVVRAALLLTLTATSCRPPATSQPGAGSLRIETHYSVLVFEMPDGRVMSVLPAGLRSGDFVSWKLAVEDSSQQMFVDPTAEGPLAEYRVEVGSASVQVQDVVVAFAVPDAAATVAVRLRDSEGSDLAEVLVPVADESSAGGVALPAGESVPALALSEQLWALLFIEGAFDGDLRNTLVELDGRLLEVLQESPRELQAVVSCGHPGGAARLRVLEPGSWSEQMIELVSIPRGGHEPSVSKWCD